jgi:hypothetical protein
MNFLTDFTGLNVYAADTTGNIISSTNSTNNTNTSSIPSTPIRKSTAPIPKGIRCSSCHKYGHNKAKCSGTPCNGTCDSIVCEVKKAAKKQQKLDEKNTAEEKKAEHKKKKQEATLTPSSNCAKWNQALTVSMKAGGNPTQILTSICDMIQKEAKEQVLQSKKRSFDELR